MYNMIYIVNFKIILFIHNQILKAISNAQLLRKYQERLTIFVITITRPIYRNDLSQGSTFIL